MKSTMVLLIAVAGTVACHASDLLRVPPPAGVVTSSALDGQQSAEAAFYTARTDLFNAIDGPTGVVTVTELLSDEFTVGMYAQGVNIDARMTTAANGFSEEGDTPLMALVAAHGELALDLVPLTKYELGSGLARIGEAYALLGYSELFLAEDYCAGVPLSQQIFGGGIQYAAPVSSDSLYGMAEAHFDSALAHANGNDTVMSFARVGLGRTLVDRNQLSAADTTVQAVPTGFVYNMIGQTDGSFQLSANMYENAISPLYYSCPYFNVANREGQNGVNFIAAQDPRLSLDSTITETCDGIFGLPDSVFYYPIKFGNPSTDVPLATGVEARLISAEAALATSPSTWAADLNALRADSADTHVVFPASEVAMPVDSTTGASTALQLSVMFRERAFWLFGTGTRLGDLRRLVRQYKLGTESVFPTGPYLPGLNPAVGSQFPIPVTAYGTDVSLTLPTQASGLTTANPYYKGCTSPTTAA